jgi:glutamyl-tRNA synthetase
MRPRVRFAPSPTGYLHVGGARTALFNWLYARRHGGTFVLRIEDTDIERSSDEMVEGIFDGLRWLGLTWDEGPAVGGDHGPYFQSGRLEKYRAMAARLVESRHAYYCYCSPEDLKRQREVAEQAGTGWKYPRTCCALEPDRVAELEAAGVPRAIRFKVPDGGVTSFHDLVHGEISVPNDTIEDFVVLRSDGHPTYHLSVVADDIDMAITHVVRGDDHISNTPKQVLLYGALAAELPAFAHVPLILGPDKKRLSKRHGATSVMEYQKRGILPDAMFNFLALLGWSPGDDREVMTRDELIAAFTLEGISGGNAVFNPDKLEWFNQQHIMRMDPAEIGRRVEQPLRAAGMWREEFRGGMRGWFNEVLDLLKPRARTLGDFVDRGMPFFSDQIVRDHAAVQKHLGDPAVLPHLAALKRRLAELDVFDPQILEVALRTTAEERGVKAATLIHATRVAVTGQAVSPGLFEVLTLIGKRRVLRRLEEFADPPAR